MGDLNHGAKIGNHANIIIPKSIGFTPICIVDTFRVKCNTLQSDWYD